MHAARPPVASAILARVSRRRIAVIAVVLTALVGEWIGHALAYWRAAGLAGLHAAVNGGLHPYMLPLGVVLLAAAATGTSLWVRAWLSLGRQLDRSLRVLRPPVPAAAAPAGRPPRAGTAPTLGRAIAATATAIAALQLVVYVVQENLERITHGMPGGGLAPLLGSGAAALWIQSLCALVLAILLVLLARITWRRRAQLARRQRLLHVLWVRARRPAPEPCPRSHDVLPIRLVLRAAQWQRPPPATSPA